MKFSNEMISAYADGELQGNEKIEFEKELQLDAQLCQALDDLYILKMQLKDAYEGVDTVAPVEQVSTNYSFAAYLVFLIVAFSSGWISSDLMHSSGVVADTGTAQVVQEKRIVSVTEKSGKYILHIGQRDNARFKKALDEAEALMARYKNNRQDIELEIIANAGGLDLFRKGATPYAERVKQISARYPGIRFIACANAIERLREKGLELNLINTVQHDDTTTAIDQIVKRVHEGWRYIKI
ncbi:hypothetical protein MNBD_GAMMA11-3130 [hydrothermal vent metagenome]|uniref:Uncharacterized protein n=1 Tax=hydrothermal vent metagenome TaxID=652676 RepID=A0A3B0X2H0_9ZZZZ